MPETDMIDSGGESQADSRLNTDLNGMEEVSENDESLHVEHGLNTNYDSSDGAIPVHRCDRCEYETMSKSSWLTHIASCQASGDEKRKLFECDVCNMKFSNGANMRRHKMRHTGFKPYECRVCQKRFFRKDHLAEHFTTHTKTLPYHCPICNRGFQRQIAMRAHFQNEHVGQNDIVKSCPLCSYRANSMKSLRVHFYNRHGIDLDRPVGGDSNGNGAGGSDSGDSIRSGDNATPPMHFLTPQVEISLPEPPSPSQQIEAASKGDQTEGITVGEESPVSSPHSGDSNIPTSSRLDPENGPLTPSVSLIPIKQEMEAEEVHRGQPVNLSTRSGGTAATLTSLIKVSPLTTLLREDFRPTSTETDSGWRSKPLNCGFCGIGFPDQTLYFLHKGCHSDSNPWKCNICGEQCSNVYDFNSHLLSKTHQ